MDWIRDILEIACFGLVFIIVGWAMSFAKSYWDDKARLKAVIIVLVLACAGFWFEGLVRDGARDKGYLAGYEAGYQKGYDQSREDLFEDGSYNTDEIEYDDTSERILDDMNDTTDNGHEW